jgi:hypothetical protein
MLINVKLPEDIRAYFQRQGKIGAAKRKAVLTPERRSEIARMAAQARWSNLEVSEKATRGNRKKGTK